MNAVFKLELKCTIALTKHRPWTEKRTKFKMAWEGENLTQDRKEEKKVFQHFVCKIVKLLRRPQEERGVL